MGLGVCDGGVDLRAGGAVRVGVGEAGQPGVPVGDGLGPPVELGVVGGQVVVGEVGGVPARVGDLDQLDVLVALGHVVGEPERLGQRAALAVDQPAEQALVGVGELQLLAGDVGDRLDLVDDLRVGEVGRGDLRAGVVEVGVAVALGVVGQGQRLPVARVGQVPQELDRFVVRLPLLVGEQQLVADPVGVLVRDRGEVAVGVEEELGPVRPGHHPGPGRVGATGLLQVQVHTGWMVVVPHRRVRRPVLVQREQVAGAVPVGEGDLRRPVLAGRMEVQRGAQPHQRRGRDRPALADRRVRGVQAVVGQPHERGHPAAGVGERVVGSHRVAGEQVVQHAGAGAG